MSIHNPSNENNPQNQATPMLKLARTRTNRKAYNFYINNNIKNKAQHSHRNNTIDTSKYNIFTFLPKALLFQFMRLANCYFLIITIIQCIHKISPLSPSTAIAPFTFVLCVSIMREGIEDYMRHQYDKMMNNEKVFVYREDRFIETNSGSLRVGELVLVQENESFPADLILLDSSLSEGIAFIETGTLDGEKTLKPKMAHKTLAGFFNDKNSGKCEQGNFFVEGECTCDPPNSELYKIEGNLAISMKSPSEESRETVIPIEAKQLLLKGAILKNTQWVIGFVIYTGKNTKLILNSKKPRMKYSRVERLMSKMIIVILLLQMSLCIICAILYSVYYETVVIYNPYIPHSENLTEDSVLNYFTYMLLLNTMIPISLIISLEIVKFIQGIFTRMDVELYSHVRHKFAKAGSISLNEELGQVNYIFSDKTGTLTCNKMVFKYCVIGDVCYEYLRGKGEQVINQLNNKLNNQGITHSQIRVNAEEESKLRDEMNIKTFGPGFMNSYVTKFENDLMTNNGINRSRYDNFKVISETNPKSYLNLDQDFLLINEYWKALSIAHECVCNEVREGVYEYSGLSPDDIELVKTAADQGYQFIKSPSTDIKRIKIGKEHRDFQILRVLEFSSERKRMSIIIRDGEQIKLYSKGADSEIKKRLSNGSRKDFLEQANSYVDTFAAKGLRTLFLAMKVIDEEYFLQWDQRLNDAELNLNGKDEAIKKCYDEIEDKLYLLGATIVEDRLQDKVPETIRDLRLAKIKVWMLTGDKMNTAYNIGLSCNLISKTNKNFTLKGEDGDTLEMFVKEFSRFCKEFNNSQNGNGSASDSEVVSDSKNNFNISNLSMQATQPFSILIDAVALNSVLLCVENRLTFLKIACQSSSVICCRVSPLQKSEVVAMMKSFDSSAVTLSIGDGGNDVSMIMEAHIGVGVHGEEGMRAVQASDFAIGEFKLLRRLLMFHGRVNNIRISEMILYFFFKNFIFTIIHFYYGFYNNFSGQSIFDDWFISFYNMIFTALPLGVRALSDFDLLPEDGLVVDKMFPFLYKENRDHPIFTKSQFIFSLFRGVCFGIITFFLSIYTLNESCVDSYGNVAGLWYTSADIFTSIFLIVSFRILTVQKHFVWVTPVIMFVTSWIPYFGFVAFVQFNSSYKSEGTMGVLYGGSKYYLTMLLTVTCSCLIDKAIYAYGLLFNDSISGLLMVQRMLLKEKQLDQINEMPELIQKEFKKYALYENGVAPVSPVKANLKDLENVDRIESQIENLEKEYAKSNRPPTYNRPDNTDLILMEKAYSKKFSLEVEKMSKMLAQNSNKDLQAKIIDADDDSLEKYKRYAEFYFNL